MKKKFLLFLFLLALAVSGFYFGESLYFGTAQAGTNVVGIITSNTTWTKANSPYTLTGPVAVNTGVTLTIEAGSSVNLNNYYIQVNGTLVANGSDTDKISFNNGKIIFTSVSVGWNELTGSGCIIENAILDRAEVWSGNPLKVSKSIIDAPITAGSSSVISYNNIVDNDIHVGSSSIISNNNITRILYAGSSSTISNNTIYYVIAESASLVTNNTVYFAMWCSFSVITNNTLSGSIQIRGGLFSNNLASGLYFEGATITNNTFYGGIHCNGAPNVVSYNTVYGGIVSGTVGLLTITHNTASGVTVEIGQSDSAKVSVAISHNNIINGGGIRMGPASWPNEGGISDNATISDNNASWISLGDCFINATIERNIIAFGGDGIAFGGATATVANNTIAFNNVGIRLGSSSTIISHNNFQNNSAYNIYLSSSATGNVDAANNWWGTTDTQAINQSIFDFKNDFTLGKVNFVPFLTAPNPAAPTIPTFNILASAGTGGSIDPSGSISVTYGGNQTFTITADTGYHIVDVIVDGSSVGVVSSYTFTNVQAAHTISATFAPTPTPSPSPSPSPTPTPSPTATPSPTPTPSPSPTPSPNPSPSPTATPTPTPTPAPTPTPTPSPTPAPTPSPTATPSPSPSPQPTATASPSPQPTTGIYLSIPLVYAIVIAFITLIAIIAALIIKRKR